MDIIKIEKLTKYYGKSRGIIDLDLIVKEGEIFGFIGPNGAGKSTTIRTLLGLINKTSGNAWIFGKDITKHKEEILSDIGYLPSETSFYSDMKVIEVIKLSASLHKKDCEEEAKMLTKRLALDVNKKICELSLGNRKKVGIVCALQHKPKLYILDEPTSGLDPLIKHEFYELLKMRAKDGATIFLSSHSLSEVQKYCSRAAVIKDGRINAIDTVENLGNQGAKRVVINGYNHPLDLNQVKDLKITDDGMEFLYSGDINILLKEISQYSIRDISITEPDLEEVFMHYYCEENKNDNI